MRSECVVKPVLVTMLALVLVGCSRARTEQTVVSRLGTSTDSQLDFWHELARERLASNDDMSYALLLFINHADAAKDYPSRVTTLKQLGMLPASFDEPAQLAATRGNVAVAVAKLLDIRGGVMMRLLGSSPRYATRELIDRGVYPVSSPNQTFSGTELVGVIGRVEDAQAAH